MLLGVSRPATAAESLAEVGQKEWVRQMAMIGCSIETIAQPFHRRFGSSCALLG